MTDTEPDLATSTAVGSKIRRGGNDYAWWSVSHGCRFWFCILNTYAALSSPLYSVSYGASGRIMPVSILPSTKIVRSLPKEP